MLERPDNGPESVINFSIQQFALAIVDLLVQGLSLYLLEKLDVAVWQL